MARARILGSRGSRPLGGDWEIAALPPGSANAPADLDALNVEWIPCDGPVPAAAALRSARRWSLESQRDFDAEDWWYRCRFSAAQPGEHRRLRFEGLATIADVWLNGDPILHSDSMFVAHKVDLPRSDRAVDELVFRFHALSPLLASKRPRPRWRTRLVSDQGLRWHRTSLVGRIQSWCPPVAPVGPWRPISIETSPLAVEAAEVHAALDGETGVIRIQLRVSSAAPAQGVVSVGDLEVALKGEGRPPTSESLSAIVRVPNAERWWPHTHGAQPLYDIRAVIRAGDVTETVDLGRAGFRTIDVDRGADGQGFGLIVNGSPIFCRGACWTPLDVTTLGGSPAAYRAALGQLRAAGMNMVRLGGAFAYETDSFHVLCDELGILVWQDFMFASMDYPVGDREFARQVEVEAKQVLDALQSRPSLAVLCGGSEIGQQAAMLGLPESRRSNPLLEEHLGPLVQAAAPGTVWVPETPSGGTFPFQVNSGVSHYYGVGAYQRPFEDARASGVRFAAECLAFSNVPDDASPERRLRVPRDPGAGWDFEDVRDHYVERLFGADAAEVRAWHPDRYLALGRVATGEAMLRTFAEWRRPGSTCRGGLVWFARDLWPGAGWGVVDSSGEPKAAYWFLKRVLAPVALMSADEGLNGLWLHAVNDGPEPIEADLRVALYRNGVLRTQPVGTTLTIPARGHRTIHADGLFDGFIDLTYAYRFGPPEHDTIASSLRNRATGELLATACHVIGTLPLEQLDLGLMARAEPAHNGYLLELATDRFAHAVTVDVDGWLPDDNYFHLEPGETRRVWMKRVGAGAFQRGIVSALNGSDRATIAVTEAIDVHAG